MGPQGVGKSTLARSIARGMPHLKVQCPDADDTRGLSNAQVRSQYADADIVCVERQQLGACHADLQPGDLLIQLASAPPIEASLA